MRQKVEIDSGKDSELFSCPFAVTDENLNRLYGGLLPVKRFIIKPGEQSKNLYTVQKIVEAMLGAGIKRTDRIAAFGGGVVGDITGFVASIYMRGISWINFPTSLLAMADSCIGGKTAVNVGRIKNAVGSFYLPEATYIETKYLRTLPKTEYLSGMGEIVKTSLIDADLFDYMHGKFVEREAIERCIKVKSRITEADFKDNGARRALNMGHTVGHAVEMLTGLAHGACVLIGLRLEALMMRDYIDNTFFYELQSYLNGYIKFMPALNASAITKLAISDKKNDGPISIMYAKNIGDIREAKLTESEFVALLKEAL